MKKLLLLAIVVLFTVSFTFKASAQDTKTNTAGAEILLPIKLTVVNPLEFGTLAIVGLGNVTIAASDNPNAQFSGNVTEVASNTLPRTAASFTVEGSSTYTYALTVPAQITISTEASGDGDKDMIIDTDVKTLNGTNIDGVNTTESVLTGGSDVIYVGGKLNIKANQNPGRYTADFNVTVVYN